MCGMCYKFRTAIKLKCQHSREKISFQQEFILSYNNLELELHMYGLWNHLESRTCGLCLRSTFFKKKKRVSYNVDMPNSNVDEVCLSFPL